MTVQKPRTLPLQPEDRERLAALIGDAQPATDELLGQIAESIRDRREHEHLGWMGSVLRRLLDAVAETERLQAELEERTQLLRAVQATARKLRKETDGRREHGQRLTAENARLRDRIITLEQILAETTPVPYTLTRQAEDELYVHANSEALRRRLAPSGTAEAGGRP